MPLLKPDIRMLFKSPRAWAGDPSYNKPASLGGLLRIPVPFSIQTSTEILIEKLFGQSLRAAYSPARKAAWRESIIIEGEQIIQLTRLLSYGSNVRSRQEGSARGFLDGRLTYMVAAFPVCGQSNWFSEVLSFTVPALVQSTSWCLHPWQALPQVHKDRIGVVRKWPP
ncbi:hypothetical protein BDV26DRAFT_292308 [Aspergillus bertholletiae]|uniref:Uncharacterized protein n=1 Tax=Aspergillus bertholletiae TaxID=1226010 RepID=A0A5N7B9D8_9EURO|nr:hypothetical protein BDV26DRAFT_292308 [Aspergillus bertholletiae]